MSTSTDFRSTPIDRRSFTTPFTGLISGFSLAPSAAMLIYMDDQAIELIDQLHIVNLEDDTLIFNPDKIKKPSRQPSSASILKEGHTEDRT